MGTQGPGRKRIPNQDKLNAEDDALSQIAREAEARLAAKRAARAEAREIRMKELERQQKELFHSHKKYYGLDYKWGHIEQWMEESERYSGLSRRHASISDDEERMSVGSRGSLRPSDYGGLLGSSSRTSSRASSARASPVVEERTDREFFDKGSRTASTLSATTLASLGGASSRRGSCDTSISIETEASIRDMKDSLVEAEEKYRRAMVSNAQLHNDKTTLMFQVETLREELGDLEELLWEARRHCDNCNKELERERQAHRVLQLQFTEMKETLRRTEGLLTEVSDLRMKSSSFRQEVSDLQEALQWKEKKIEALERHRETSDRVQMDRDRLRDQVVRLRDLLKKHGALVSPDVATNGDAERSEDDVSTEPGCRLAKECPGGGGESPGTGKTEDLQDSFSPRRASKQSHPLKTSWTSDRSRPAKGGQSPGDRTPTGSSRTKRDTTRKLLQNQPVLTPDQDSKDLPRPDSGGVEGERHDSTVSVCTASSEKVLRSRLVPPRPAEEMILVNRAVVLSLLTAEGDKQKPVLEKKASCSVGVSAGPDGGKTQEILNQTLGNSLKEHEPGRGDVTETNPCSAVSEARLRPEEVPSSLMEKSGSSDDFQTQMILKAVQGTAEAHRGLPELPESKIAAFVPEEIQTGLEETVQDMLRGLADKPGLVVEISRIFSEMLTSLHRWTSGLENSVGNESRLFDGSGPEPTRTNTKSSHLLDRTRQTESPGGPEGSLVEPAGEPSGSTGKVRPDVQDQSTTNDREDVVHSRRGRSSSEEESGLSPAEETLSGKKPSEDFVFVDSYFSEPLHTMMESKSDPGPSQSEPGPSQSESHPVGSGKELRSSGASVSSNAGQSSAVKRLIEMTTEELKAIAVPELVLLNLQEGRRLDESSRPNHGSLEDVSPGHVDSCEEAGEEELLQPVSEHQTPSRMEAGDLKVLPTVGRDKPEGKHEGTSRRDENMDCRLS